MKRPARSFDLVDLVDLAAQARHGDDYALERLLAEVHVHIHRYLARWLHRRRGWEDTIDDLAQETLIRIARGLESCGAATDAMLLEWVHAVARNVGIDYLRSMRDEWEQTEFLGDACAVVDSEEWGREIHEEPGIRIMLRVLGEVHAEESEDAQELLWYRLVQGDEWADTGGAIGIPHTAAKRRYQRAQGRLRCAVLKRLINLAPEELSAVRRWLTRIDMAVPSLTRTGHLGDA